MKEPTHHEILIDLFHQNGNVLTTAQLARHPILCAEYRRDLVDIRKKGYAYERRALTKSNHEYRLVLEPGPPRPLEQAELLPEVRSPMAGH